MKKINSVIDLKELKITKQGTDGVRLEIWSNNDLGKEVMASEIVVDFKDLLTKLKQEKN